MIKSQHKHTIAGCLVTSAFLIALSACGSGSDKPADSIDGSQAEIAKLEVVDFTNKKIRLNGPAKRVVALAPHIVENLFAIGAGDTLVGVVAHSDFPEQANDLPLVGGYEETNHERIVQLQPDLIIAWESGNSHASVSKLRELGFPVIIDQPDSLEDIARSLRMLGKATGTSVKANTLANEFLENLMTVREQNKTKDSVSVFYQVWNEPLYTISGNHIISDAIRSCGGTNVFADEQAVAPRVGIEAVIERNPDAIIASGMGESRPEWLEDWRQWPTLNAVKNDFLFHVNPDHLQRHTTRQTLAIERICTYLDQVRAESTS